MPGEVQWFEDWDALAADADGALDRDRQPRLFDRLDWHRRTHRLIMPDRKSAILRVRQGDAAAWLFLTPEGGRAGPLTSWYSLGGGPIMSGNPDKTLLLMLFREVARRFSVLTLYPLDRQQAVDLQPALRSAGWHGFAARISTNWTIDLSGRDFATYWSERPAKLRNTVARRSRSHPLDIQIHRSFDPAAWQAYEDIYANSWKPDEGSPAFLRALAEEEGQTGTLRLGIATDSAGQPIAAQFWLVENGIATIHKLAHREEAKAGSPGSILSHAMFRTAIDEDRVARIDFGLGDEPYKAEWMDTRRPVFRIDAYRPFSLRGAFGILREIASRLAHPRRLD